MAKSVSELVAAAKSRIENLNPDAAERELAAGALLVDLRELDELAQHGRIPGSVHIPRGRLEWRADPSAENFHHEALDPARRVILHCAGGGRSALAVLALQELGYTDVAHLEFGFASWRDAGKPVEPA